MAGSGQGAWGRVRVSRRWAAFDDAARRRFEAEQGVPAHEGGALCIFEFIYFGRPDSKLRGVELHRGQDHPRRRPGPLVGGGVALE